MKTYNTEQRNILLSFFEKHPDEDFCANDICENLSGKISKSAVYRNLSDLTAVGAVVKKAGSGRENLYRFSGAEACKNCLHVCCTVCKKTFHLDGKTATKIEKALSDGDGFGLDRAETVLYGICPSCKK